MTSKPDYIGARILRGASARWFGNPITEIVSTSARQLYGFAFYLLVHPPRHGMFANIAFSVAVFLWSIVL